MARLIGTACRLCRREGIKLFLKGDRCTGEKCSFDKRGFNPGQHGRARARGRARAKISDYGIQLREKQKVKRIYGLMEKQFRFYFKKAERQKGVTGEILLQLLERRLDNTIFRCCFASSRPDARQMVRHGLVCLNGKRVNIPSYQVKKDDSIEIQASDKHLKEIAENVKLNKERGIPKWIQLDDVQLSATVADLPKRDDVGFPIEEQLIVELYSK